MSDVDLRRLGLGAPPERPRHGPRWPLGFVPRLRSWLWHHRRSLLVAGLATAMVAAVTLIGAGRSPMPSDDEGTYLAQAWAVQVKHQMAHYTYWYDHPPLGWIQIALWTWITGTFHHVVTHAVMAGRYLMVILTAVSAVMVYVVARRLRMQRWAAVMAVLLFGLSPLAVAFHRQVFLDNIAVAWLMAAFALALSPRRSLWAAAASGLCFAVAVLTKETVLILAPALVWQLWQQCDRRTRAFCITAFATVFVLSAATYPLYALLKGELLPGSHHVSMLDAAKWQLFSRTGSGSIFSAGTSAHHTVAGWMALDRWLMVAGACASIGALLVRRLRPLAAALLIQIVMLVRGGYLPGPFVIAMLPFAALLVAGVAQETWLPEVRWRTGRRPEPTVVVARLAVVVAMVIGALSVAGPWYRGNRRLMTADASRPWSRAAHWVEDNVPRKDRVIVDDTMWVDLVDRGFDPNFGVVWFYKLDTSNNLDPSVARHLPGGWRDFQYIVSTPTLRGSIDVPGGFVPVHDALTHSTVVASYGSGGDLVEVRRVDPGTTPHPATPGPAPAP